MRVRVTGPSASAQVRLKVWPAVTESHSGAVLVNSGRAWARAKTPAAKMKDENCILNELK